MVTKLVKKKKILLQKIYFQKDLNLKPLYRKKAKEVLKEKKNNFSF